MRRWSIRTAQCSCAVQKILANCCKMQKRCYSAGKLVNWSEGEDKVKMVGYCQILICMQVWSFFLTVIPQIQICVCAITIMHHATSDEINCWRECTEWYREFKENLSLKSTLRCQLMQSWLLSLKPSNTSSCILRGTNIEYILSV